MRLFDESVSTQAFERFRRVRRGAFRNPILSRRDGQSSKFAIAFVEGSRDSHQQQRRCFGFEREIRQHVPHQRLIDQRFSECPPVSRVMNSLIERLPHQCCRSHHAIEARVLHHVDDGRDAAAFFADPLRPRAVKFHFARRVRTVPEFLFQALEMKRVALPVAGPARHEKAGESAGSLRQHQKCIAHRRRAEPLVTVNHVFIARNAFGASRVRAHVGPALLFGHRHADQHARFLPSRTERRIVTIRMQARLPLGRQRGIAAQHRHGRIRHRDRTHVSGFILRREHRQSRARHVRTRLRIRPRKIVHAVFDR